MKALYSIRDSGREPVNVFDNLKVVRSVRYCVLYRTVNCLETVQHLLVRTDRSFLQHECEDRDKIQLIGVCSQNSSKSAYGFLLIKVQLLPSSLLSD